MKKYLSCIQIFTFLTILVLGTACNGQVKKDLPNKREHPKLIKNISYGNVQCGMQDKAGNLWFGTSDGLYKYDGKSFSRFTETNGLNIINIFSIFEDMDGKIWIGTGKGLYLYDGKTFANIQIPLSKNLPASNDNNHQNSNWVFSILQAKSGKLWFATINGVFVYDGNSLTQFIVNEEPGGYMRGTNNNVERILEDKAGNLWFGGRGNDGVYRYDGKSVTNFKLKELFHYGPKPKANTWAWPQWQDRNGNIWFSNWGGAYRYDGKSFTSFIEADSLSSNIGAVTEIMEDKNGNILFGGADGLCRYDGKTFTYFKDGLINPWIWAILEDKSGNIWVGTRQVGLYLFDGKMFIAYSEYKH